MRRFLVVSLVLLAIVTAVSWWALKISTEVMKKEKEIRTAYEDVAAQLRATNEAHPRPPSPTLEADRFGIYLVARKAIAAEIEVQMGVRGVLPQREARNAILAVVRDVLDGRRMSLREYLAVHRRTQALIMRPDSFWNLEKRFDRVVGQVPEEAPFPSGLEPTEPADEITPAERALLERHEKDLAASMEAVLLAPLLERIAKNVDTVPRQKPS